MQMSNDDAVGGTGAPGHESLQRARLEGALWALRERFRGRMVDELERLARKKYAPRPGCPRSPTDKEMHRLADGGKG